MYASRTTQLIVGIFALLGIAALAYLALSLGKVNLFGTSGYILYADFDNVSGLRTGDAVELAGIKVGKVQNMRLVGARARLALLIEPGVKIDDEAFAAIRTRGIIGDKYVSISPGAGERVLGNGDQIRQTESSFVLEEALAQLIGNAGMGGTKGKRQ